MYRTLLVVAAAGWVVPGWLAARVLDATVEPGPAGTVIAANMNDNTATIIDAASNRVLATLPTGEGPHEVATSRDGRWAAVSNYGIRGKPGNTLTVIDLDRLAVDRTISLGSHQRPHGIAFYPGDTLLTVTSETSKAVLLVDLRTNQVIGTAPTGGRTSHMLALVPDGSRVFTSNIVDGTVSEIDPRARRTRRTIPVGRMDEGIAVSPDGKTVWSGSNGDSTVVVVDVPAGHAVDTLRGFGMPYRLAATPDGKRVVISDPVRSEIWIVNARTRKRQTVIRLPADSVLATAEVPGSASPEGVTVSRDSRWAFVTLQGRDRMVTIDLERGVITGWAPTGAWSDGIAYSPRVVR
jgi:YVTN family beta-propeller protein